jgi:membrane protein YdbS with pleckstrin-like domain
MRARRKRIMKQLTRRARQEDEAEHRDHWQQREQRKADIMRSFERRRVWFVALILAFLLLPTLLLLAPQQIWNSYALLIVLVVVIEVVPLVARFRVWRCPNCNRALPLNTRFGPFERRREECPYCGVRLE